MVRTFLTSAALLAASTLALAAQPLKPIQASTIDLGATHGYAYFTAEPQGFRVVATLDTGREPVRFDTTLADGQSATVSVPSSRGEAAIEITFVRKADTLEVLRRTPSDAVTATTRY